MSFEGRTDAPDDIRRRLASFARAVSPSLAAGVLLGSITMSEGAPALAFGFTAVSSSLLGALIYLVGESASRDGWGAKLGDGARYLRALSKPTQLMLIAFAVTSIFALELRFDVVPNRYGFVELILPLPIA